MFHEGIVLPFPFAPYVKGVCGTSGEGAISCITWTCKKSLHAHKFFCFHPQAPLGVQIQAEKAILKLFFFLKKWVVIKPLGLTTRLKLVLTILLNWGLGVKIPVACSGKTCVSHWKVRIGPWMGSQWNASLCGTGQSCSVSLRWSSYCQLCV